MKALLIFAFTIVTTLLCHSAYAAPIPFDAYCHVQSYGRQEGCVVKTNNDGHAVVEASAVGMPWLDKTSSESKMTIAIRNETGNVGIAMFGSGYANDMFFANGTGRATTVWTDEVRVKDSVLADGSPKTITFYHELHFKTGATGGGSRLHQSNSTMSISSHFNIRDGWSAIDPSKLEDGFAIEGSVTDQTLAHSFTIETTVGSTLYFGYQMDTTLRYELTAPSDNYPFPSQYRTVLDAYNSAHIYAMGDENTTLVSLSGHNYSKPLSAEIPEPSTTSLLLIAGLMGYFARKKLRVGRCDEYHY